MLKGLLRLMKEAARAKTKNPDIISFRALRKAVGWLGISLPFVLVAGAFLFGCCCQIQPTISHYYYTNMREIFVGILCAVSLFLFSYKGYSRLDNISANAAGFFSLCTALFPTDVICNPCQANLVSFITVDFHQYIHLTSASAFLVILALMSIFLFTKSEHAPAERTTQKKKRNRLYRICGVVMLAGIASAGLYLAFAKKGAPETQFVFWMETLALVSFGLSWLTKGEGVLKDK